MLSSAFFLIIFFKARQERKQRAQYATGEDIEAGPDNSRPAGEFPHGGTTPGRTFPRKAVFNH